MAGHGRYTIVSKLADGGMAEIFLGIQHGAEGFQKPVVLKRVLTAFSADPQFRNMFLDEAHISMSLNHSNVVQVLDLGVSRGRYFLVLELVDGWDLDKIMHRAKAASMVWPPALSLYVVAEVCRALAFAHGKHYDGKPLGIVHRDISPNNVLISEQGEVKLADFGIAKAQRKREQTAAGVIKGKIAFMSPEQATGAAIDRRSDLFSVGSMLYLMATDKLPFESATDLEAIFRVQRADFTAPEVARPGVGTEVSRIIMRAMRLTPAERYQTADEMLVDVERVLRTEYQSAGQTELKLWMAQLARRDGSQSIGKTRPGSMATIADGGGTDLNVVGSSFELVDFDEVAVAASDAAFAPGAVVSGGPGKGPPPIPQGTPSGLMPVAPEVAPPPRDTAAMRAIEQKSRGLRGFWFGAMFALAAVIGARYAIEWARTQPFFGRVLGNAAAPAPAAPPAAGVSPAPAKPARVAASEKGAPGKPAKAETPSGGGRRRSRRGGGEVLRDRGRGPRTQARRGQRGRRRRSGRARRGSVAARGAAQRREHGHRRRRGRRTGTGGQGRGREGRQGGGAHGRRIESGCHVSQAGDSLAAHHQHAGGRGGAHEVQGAGANADQPAFPGRQHL